MKRIIVVLLLICLIGAMVLPVSAESDGNFDYTVSDNRATITGYKGPTDSLVIPETLGGYPVTKIGDDAFAHCGGPETLVLPDTVKEIGERAFEWNTGIRRVELPEGLERIGKRAFYWSDSLQECSLPDSLICIGEEAFYGTDVKNVTLGSALRELGSHSFMIGDDSFILKISPENANFMIRDGLLLAKEQTELLFVLPDAGQDLIVPDGVIAIAPWACMPNTGKYVSLTLPDSVETIGANAFMGCENLSTVRFGASLKTVEHTAFFNCSSIKELSFPDTLRTIETDAFGACKSISALRFGTGLIEVGTGAFSHCSSLSELLLPDALQTIGDYAFQGLRLVRELKLPGALQTIGDHAFDYCDDLETVFVPASVEKVGSQAFSNCFSLKTITFYGSPEFADLSIFTNDLEPPTDKEIPTDITLVLAGNTGSSVQLLAQQCGFEFFALDAPDPRDEAADEKPERATDQAVILTVFAVAFILAGVLIALRFRNKHKKR